MVEYMLRDGLPDGVVARIMGWTAWDVGKVRKALGEFRTREAADRRRIRDRMYRAAVRHQRRFSIKETA